MQLAGVFDTINKIITNRWRCSQVFQSLRFALRGIYQLHEHLERFQDKVGTVRTLYIEKGLRLQAFFCVVTTKMRPNFEAHFYY